MTWARTWIPPSGTRWQEWRGLWVSLADTPSAFAGHGYCDGHTIGTQAGPWFNLLAADVDAPTQTNTFAQPGSFHPNGYGQELGFEKAFVNAGA